MIKRILLNLLIISSILINILSFADVKNEMAFSEMKTISFKLPKGFFSVGERTLSGDSKIELPPGIHHLTVHFNGSSFIIPIQVTDEETQDFTLFTPEEFLVKIEGENQQDEPLNIDLSAIVFEPYNSILIGTKKEILVSNEISNGECFFTINNPIHNNRVNHYLLSIRLGDNRYQKNLILAEGVSEFLKGYNPLIFDIKEGKNVSLFESEWVAGRKTESEIVYRDQQRLKSILITSLPDNAEIYYGNELLGVTPLELFFTEDTYVELTIRKEGYYEKYLEIELKDSKTEYYIELEERNEEEEIEL